MEKMRMESVDRTKQNVDKIAELFPNCITEAIDEEKSTPEKRVYKKGVNFDLLKEMLSGQVKEGDESYEFTWVGKKAAIIEANKPIRKTLRPCKDESVNWDITENLYIKGDNLEVLKLLQESYLGAIKMIYIDPPYNTGNDFIYRDNFGMDEDEYLDELGILNEDGEKLFRNTDSNGRFHSDWCSMIYSRLMLARNLLKEDGVIFISMDDDEQATLKLICDEIFGARNFVDTLIWKKLYGGKNDSRWFAHYHDYILVYAKNKEEWHPNLLPRDEKQNERYKNPDNDPRGPWTSADFSQFGPTPNCVYEIITPNGTRYYPKEGKRWITTYDSYLKLREENRLWFGENGGNMPRLKRYLSEVKSGVNQSTFLDFSEVGHSDEANKELKELLGGKFFDYPKPSRLLYRLCYLGMQQDDIVLDFFSGSATTAQAVMQLNKDDGGKRKFILVQLEEKTDEKSEAYKAGYKNICEIGEDRIKKYSAVLNDDSVDTGFRVFRLDETNMNDVYYAAGDYSQGLLSVLESNIKADRNDMDLLFGCLIEWGIPLSLPYKSEKVSGYTIHDYNEGDLVACFDENVTTDIIKEIAKRKPLRAVFRDSSFVGSPEKINVEELFKLISPDTRVKVI